MANIFTSRKRSMVATGAGVTAIILALLTGTAMEYRSTGANAEEQGSSYAGMTELSVVGNAVQKMKPDRASISLAVEVQEKTAGDAAMKNAEIMSMVVEAIKAVGVKEEQISTNYYSIYPVYESRNKPDTVCIAVYPPPPECQEQVLVGYKAVNSIIVTVDLDSAQDVGRIIDAAVSAGANQVHGVSFFISQESFDSARASLLDNAVMDAKTKAEAVAGALNMKVSGVKSVNIIDGYYPVYRTIRIDAQETTTPILPPEEQSVSASVQVVFWLKQE